MPLPTEPGSRSAPGTLVDVLDRVLDKGLVLAGDIRVSLADVELLTIRIRLLLCSIDKAQEIGLDWWRSDPELSSRARDLVAENAELRVRLKHLEERLGIAAAEPGPPVALPAASKSPLRGRKKK